MVPKPSILAKGNSAGETIAARGFPVVTKGRVSCARFLSPFLRALMPKTGKIVRSNDNQLLH